MFQFKLQNGGSVKVGFAKETGDFMCYLSVDLM